MHGTRHSSRDENLLVTYHSGVFGSLYHDIPPLMTTYDLELHILGCLGSVDDRYFLNVLDIAELSPPLHFRTDFRFTSR